MNGFTRDAHNSVLTARAAVKWLHSFRACEDGTTSLEFVIIFPVFFGFFLMTVESGVISARHVMLERGLDVAVREVRIGVMPAPTREMLTERICEVSKIIPDCENQLQLEMVRRNPRTWSDIGNSVRCIDRSAIAQPVVEFTTGDNNELVFLRACARIDPFFPTTGLGRSIANNNSGAGAKGSYALVAKGAFVVEPFN